MNARLLLSILCGAALLFAGACRENGVRPDGSGTIECTQVQVAPLVAGRILELPPREGMAVHKGDLVAKLDSSDLLLRRDELRAAVAQAQAQLDLVRAGSREEDIQRAREQVREAQVARDGAAADLARLEPVFAAGSATRKQRDDAKTALDRAAASLAAAEQGLAHWVRGSRPEEIRAAESAVAVATVRLAQVEKSVADCTVAAPLDGVVTTRNHEPGEYVTPGTSLVTISRLDEVWLSVYVPETRLARVRLGQDAHVRLDGDAKSYSGTVTFISPVAEFTPRNVQTPDERAKLVYRLKITLPNPDGVFKPGMPADGYLTEVRP